jgi:hypothetical protein
LHFVFRRIESLPRLAWCAHIREGDDRVSLLHGPWVEAREDWFVAGAWNGAFARGRFDRAHTLVGSGGRVTEAGLLFCAPSDFGDSLYSLRRGAQLWVSDSLTFLLAQTGDGLDPSYPHYVHDLADHRRRGLSRKAKTLRTRLGNRVHLHQLVDVAVSPDLRVRSVEKADCAAPRNFTEYDRLLADTMVAVADNADDAEREQRYRLVSTISQGYDSTAAMAVAARAGCREALTFAKIDPEDPNLPDGGAHIAELFGMETTEYSRFAFMRLPGIPDAEFCACPNGGDVQMAVVEEQLEGALLVQGAFGDSIWHPDRREHPPRLGRLRRKMWMTMVGMSQPEFRRRVGFLSLSVPFIGARHDRKIWEITASEEMRPWSVGGDYDRPIPRRIAEEAGVPREWFGQVKLAGMYHHFYRDGLTPNGQEDFAKFYESACRPEPLARRLGYGAMRALYAPTAAVVRALNKLGDRRSWKNVFPVPLRGRYESRVDPLQFAFHWGIGRIRDRYDVAE